LRVAEVLLEYAEPVICDGKSYIARACGDEMPGGMWQGWVEFVPIDGGEAVRSGRETTQPNRQDTAYWATGLTPVFLEGSLKRALNPLTRPVAREPLPPLFDAPAPASRPGPPSGESALNPYSVYRNGEPMLRQRLAALAGWHLVNIIRAYDLSDERETSLQAKAPGELIEMIVGAVRAESRVAP
jgi:hypothetical protein